MMHAWLFIGFTATILMCAKININHKNKWYKIHSGLQVIAMILGILLGLISVAIAWLIFKIIANESRHEKKEANNGLYFIGKKAYYKGTIQELKK